MMSAIFLSAGGPPSATTLCASSAIRVAVGELPDEFLSRLIVIFELAAGVEFAQADLPVQLHAATAIPPLTYFVSFAITAPEILPRWAIGHASPLCRVDGSTTKASEAGSVGRRWRGEAREGVQRARSMSRKAGARRMSDELQTEIEAAAASMSESKRARASSLDGFKAAIVEHEKAFDPDAFAYFVFTDQVEYDGAGHPVSSDEGSDSGGDSGREGDAGFMGVTLKCTHSGELVDSSDEDRADAECSSVESFIDNGALPDDDTINSDGSASK